jgi:para-aminobenzoate synthetase component I
LDPEFEFIYQSPGAGRLICTGSKGYFRMEDLPAGKKLAGYIAYDTKNRFERLDSLNPDHLGFPELLFFEAGHPGPYRPRPGSLRSLIPGKRLRIRQRVSRPEYIRTVQKIKQHIQRGDIYEMNYCMEFFAENAVIDPYAIYEKLHRITRAPFSSFLRAGERFIISGSPERFLQKKGKRLVSQPIKGTAPRGRSKKEDARLKNELKNSLKDRTENVMIVDLVRNDLSRVAKAGTVKADELYGIHTFNTMHQMISTVSCELKRTARFEEIIRAAFPMGSMTGAPKVRAMELIEEFEKTKRGVYSGALGLIQPNGDFDLSVVIRTILYHSGKKYLSFMVGSAITAASDPGQEYEECLVKARALLSALQQG